MEFGTELLVDLDAFYLERLRCGEIVMACRCGGEHLGRVDPRLHRLALQPPLLGRRPLVCLGPLIQ
jgi:hypothetical protein